MPGPVSDSYDPEFGTSANVQRMSAALRRLYADLSSEASLGGPLFILDVVDSRKLTRRISLDLSEREVRLLRFALERAGESL